MSLALLRRGVALSEPYKVILTLCIAPRTRSLTFRQSSSRDDSVAEQRDVFEEKTRVLEGSKWSGIHRNILGALGEGCPQRVHYRGIHHLLPPLQNAMPSEWTYMYPATPPHKFFHQSHRAAVT